MKSRLLLLSALVIAFAVTSTAAAWAQQPIAAPKKYQVFPEGPKEFGYVPPPHDLSHIKVVPGMLMAPAASWDWRTMNGVTSVKNQNPYGTCWAFAALGDLESKILINESIVNDYSEYNIQGCNPVSQDCNWGGNAYMSTNYMSLLGSVNESCDPYPGACPNATCSNPSCDFQKQVTGWKLIPNDVTAIKAALQTYGPVYTSMYASFPGFGTYDGTTCLTYTGTEDPNHGVLIVGFDDDMCSGNGAWIVKNSWGTGWGDNGYFYIQYGSARMGTSANVITSYREFDAGIDVYHFDEWGWWSSVGYGDGHDYAVVEITPATAGEYLQSIHFWATASPTTYTIEVFDDFDGSSKPTGSIAGPWTATVNEAGYYTIDLATPLSVNAGNPIYIYADLNTGSYAYPIPYDDTGSMETNKCFISNDDVTFVALDNGNYAMGDIGLRASIGAVSETGECIKDGDPGFFFGFEGGTIQVAPGETYCLYPGPTNFAFVSTTCTEADTFCIDLSDVQGWTLLHDPEIGSVFELGAGSYYPGYEICVTVPCEASVGDLNTVTAIMAFTDVNGVCAPDCGDCEDPNVYSGGNYFSTTAQDFEVVEAPPALYILQDTLYFVEQGQTAAYIPFSICNGDPCAPATDYGYNIKSRGYVGAAIDQTGLASSIVGGTCEDVYGIVDAGAANVCDYDTLTIIAWDAATGTVYDTCVQVIHVVEPVPVPLFGPAALAIMLLAMIAAAALIMRRAAANRA